MASIKYLYARKQWQIRWHITDPRSKAIVKGSKLLPKGCSRIEAENYAAQFSRKSRLIKAGQHQITDSLPIAKDKWLIAIGEHTIRTQEHYKRVINAFFDSLSAAVSNIEAITPLHISDYINSLQSEKLTNRTCNAHLTVIKSFSRWFADTYGVANPASSVKLLKEAPPCQRFITAEEYAKILAAGTDLFRQRIMFIANTGLRASEFCNLRWTDISTDLQSLTIIGKGRKKRTIPLNDTTRQILRQIPKTSSHIYLSKNSSGELHNLSRNVLYLQCAAIAAKAKIPVFGPHSLRHYFATELLVKGVPIVLVSQILGHSDIRTTVRIYGHINLKHLLGLTACLDAKTAEPSHVP